MGHCTQTVAVKSPQFGCCIQHGLNCCAIALKVAQVQLLQVGQLDIKHATLRNALHLQLFHLSQADV
eukprot:scaffold681675_cov71-Prasinocladus_malaysianus.AAC.1